MRRYNELMLGVVLGAGMMYFTDPEGGRRRRALIRDRLAHGVNEIDEAGTALRAMARHFRNRARGLLLEGRRSFSREEVSDVILEARVRAELGHLVDDPTAIQVTAEHGRVTLRGTLGEAEMCALVDEVQEIGGVHDVINRLQTKETAG